MHWSLYLFMFIFVELCANAGSKNSMGVSHNVVSELSLPCMGKASMEHRWSVQKQLVCYLCSTCLIVCNLNVMKFIEFLWMLLFNCIYFRWVAVLAFGEGWHNNHHAFEYSARHGLEWWQLDATWYVVRFLQAIGLATDVKLPSEVQKQRVGFACNNSQWFCHLSVRVHHLAFSDYRIYIDITSDTIPAYIFFERTISCLCF